MSGIPRQIKHIQTGQLFVIELRTSWGFIFKWHVKNDQALKPGLSVPGSALYLLCNVSAFSRGAIGDI